MKSTCFQFDLGELLLADEMPVGGWHPLCSVGMRFSGALMRLSLVVYRERKGNMFDSLLCVCL